MKNSFVHTGLSGCVCGSGLSDSYTADQIVGNRLKMKKETTVFIGHPGSSQTEVWKAGFVSPQVYSWVSKPDGLYWVIGELQPIRYVKHNSTSLEVVPDYGGSKYLTKPDKSIFGNIGFDFGEFEISKDQLLTAGIFVAGIAIVIPTTTFLIKKALD